MVGNRKTVANSIQVLNTTISSPDNQVMKARFDYKIDFIKNKFLKVGYFVILTGNIAKNQFKTGKESGN